MNLSNCYFFNILCFILRSDLLFQIFFNCSPILKVDFETLFSQLFRVRFLLSKWVFYKKNNSPIEMQKIVIYSKLEKIPFKDVGRSHDIFY